MAVVNEVPPGDVPFIFALSLCICLFMLITQVERKKKTTTVLTYSLYFYLIVYTAFWAARFGVTYHLLRRTVPLLLFAISQFSIVKYRFKKPLQISMGLVVVFLFVFQPAYGFADFIQLKTWTWYTLAFYLAFFVLYFEVFSRKTRNDFEASAFAILLLLVAGFTYDIPVNHKLPNLFVSVWQPFFVDSALIATCIACREFGVATFKKPAVLISTVTYVLFSVFYFFNPTLFGDHLARYARLPSLVFWLIPAIYMKKKGKND